MLPRVGSLSERLHLLDELASRAVAGLLAAVLAATVPDPAILRTLLFGGGGPATPFIRPAS